MCNNCTMMLANLTTRRAVRCSAAPKPDHIPDFIKRIDAHRTQIEEYRRRDLDKIVASIKQVATTEVEFLKQLCAPPAADKPVPVRVVDCDFDEEFDSIDGTS